MVAAVSHLPHVVAAALVNTAASLESGWPGLYPWRPGVSRYHQNRSGGARFAAGDSLLNRGPLLAMVDELIRN